MDSSSIMIKINGKISNKILNYTIKKTKCIIGMKTAPTKSICRIHSTLSDLLILLFQLVKNKAYLQTNFLIVSNRQPSLNSFLPVKLAKQQILDQAQPTCLFLNLILFFDSHSLPFKNKSFDYSDFQSYHSNTLNIYNCAFILLMILEQF